jgi:hypothetical protein
MKPEDLSKYWDAPDNSKLTPWQLSIRLPLSVSIRISALGEMYARKTRTEIIGDLLSTALDRFQDGLSDTPYKGEIEEAEREGVAPEDIADATWGDKGRYLRLLQKSEEEHERKVAEAGQGGINESLQAPSPMAKKESQAKRAPRGEGASTPATSKARPAADPRSDLRSRKRGTAGGRRLQ